jgi:hypothetical protein
MTQLIEHKGKFYDYEDIEELIVLREQIKTAHLYIAAMVHSAGGRLGIPDKDFLEIGSNTILATTVDLEARMTWLFIPEENKK